MVHSDPSAVPAGAAVLPIVPEELGIQPLFLATLHALVFLHGSDDTVVHPAAAQEQLELMAMCLQRLDAAALQRLREDLTVLAGFAKEQSWPKNAEQFFTNFMADFGLSRPTKK